MKYNQKMLKSNGICFLVKKKRQGKSSSHKRNRNLENEGEKPCERKIQLKESTINDENFKKFDKYKIIECRENIIILLKEKSNPKNFNEKMPSKQGNKKNSKYDESNLLDYDLFLKEFYNVETEPSKILKEKKRKSKGNLLFKNKVFR